MGFFNSLFGQNADPSETISRFEEEIGIQRDQLFGITLFSQGLEVMYSDQPEVLEMNRQSFQNITDRAESAISDAESLLQQAKADPAIVKQLSHFKFPTIGGYPASQGNPSESPIPRTQFARTNPSRTQMPFFRKTNSMIPIAEPLVSAYLATLGG